MKHNLFCFLFLILVNLLYYVPNTTASPIINGWFDELHLYKFHVSIHKKEGPRNEYEYLCGGNIISERYILTAAHCFITISNNVVQKIFHPVGRTKIIAGTNQRNGPGIERDVIRVFIPLEYNVDINHRADIAVAELSADLGVHQQPRRLAIVPLGVLDPLSNAGVHESATFCGFGLDILKKQRDGKFLPARSGRTINRYINVEILGRDECPTFETTICVRNAERTTFRTACIGDSGSGLLYNHKIFGVLSHGPYDYNTLSPVKFTRLNGHMKFIEEAQNPHGNHHNMHVLDERPNSPGSSSSTSH